MTRKLPVVQGGKSLGAVSPLQLYLREIAKYPLLSPEEEFEFAKSHYEEDDVGAAHRLVTSNLRLVVKIANDFKQAQISFLDLIQEGNHGLMQAVKRYNPYKGVKLSSYAGWWIRAYILKFIMDNKSLVKLGTTAAQRKLYYNLRKETEKLLEEYETADPKLIAERLDVKEDEVIEMQMRLGSPDLSLDAPIDGEDSATRGDFIPSAIATAEDVTAESQLTSIFSDHIKGFEATLKDRDLDIFRSRMLSDKPVTLQEIGDKYGISRERARQLEEKILKNLRNYVKDQGVIDV